MSRSSLANRRARRAADPEVQRRARECRARELEARAAERAAAGQRDAARSLLLEAKRARRCD